jgi:hypothetical protein
MQDQEDKLISIEVLNPVHAGNKCIYLGNSKRRGITLEPFERPLAVRSYYAKGRKE